MKICTKCKEEKELIYFSKNKLTKDGFQIVCKICVSKYKKEYYINNTEKLINKSKEHRLNNKEQISNTRKKWYQNNIEIIKNKSKEHRLNNREKIREQDKIYSIKYKEKKKEYLKKYYEQNKYRLLQKQKKYNIDNKEIINKKNKIYYKNNTELINQRNKKYYLENKKELSKYTNNYRKNRKLVDHLFKLRCNIGSRIAGAFKKKGYSKKTKTYQILGCTFEEFKLHLEKQFTKGMTWENQGEWHLDHIYPVSLAKDEEELIKLNHYTNFQPLWAFDNLSKGNKIIEKQLILI